MNLVNDFIAIKLFSDSTLLSVTSQLLPFLNLMQNGPFPPPAYMRRTDINDIKVNSYTDAKILKFLDNERWAASFYGADGKEIILIIHSSDTTDICVTHRKDFPNAILNVVTVSRQSVSHTQRAYFQAQSY